MILWLRYIIPVYFVVWWCSGVSSGQGIIHWSLDLRVVLWSFENHLFSRHEVFLYTDSIHSGVFRGIPYQPYTAVPVMDYQDDSCSMLQNVASWAAHTTLHTQQHKSNSSVVSCLQGSQLNCNL